MRLKNMFKNEPAETFNKCSKAYELGRASEREKAIEEYKEEVLSRFCECCDQYACNGAMIGSTQECATIRMLQDVCVDVANELKEQKNGNI